MAVRNEMATGGQRSRAYERFLRLCAKGLRRQPVCRTRTDSGFRRWPLLCARRRDSFLLAGRYCLEWSVALDPRRLEPLSRRPSDETLLRDPVRDDAVANRLPKPRGSSRLFGAGEHTIHPEFFQRIDQRIDEINAQGLLAVPVVLWSLGEEEYTPGKLPVDQAIRLARYIVARYGAHHAAWFLGGDGDFGGEAAPYWKELGRAVFDRGDHAPAFLHPRGMRWPWDDYHGETWLTALGYQSGHGDNAETLDWIHSGPPSEKWQEGPARPIINLEPPYEDHISYHTNERHSAYNVRRASYWSLLNAPMAGVSYGAHGVWSWETTSRVPLNHDRTGEARPWHQAMALPGSMDMKHMAELLAELSWWKLRPSQHLLEEQPGADDPARFVSVALSEDDHFALAYFPVGGAARLRTGSPAGGFSSAAWVNPRTGERTPSKPSESGEYQAPSSEDWVLLLRTISSSAVPLTTTVNYHQHFLIEG